MCALPRRCVASDYCENDYCNLGGSGMIVPVRCEGGSIKEWGLIELQGSIQLQREWDFSQGLPVGTIQSSPTVSTTCQRYGSRLHPSSVLAAAVTRQATH